MALKKIVLAFVAMSAAWPALAEDTRSAVRVPYTPSDIVIVNPGPNQGRTVVTSLMKTPAGVVIGECHTLFYGFQTSVERVEGFSCAKK